MKIKKFDVVELKDNNRAIILAIQQKNKYFAEVVNRDGITIDTRQISNDDIKKIIYSRESQIMEKY